MHPQGAVEWRVPIVWEMNEGDAQSKKFTVASNWAMDGECCQQVPLPNMCIDRRLWNGGS